VHQRAGSERFNLRINLIRFKMKNKYLLFFPLFFLLSHTYAQTTDYNKGMKAFYAKDYITAVTQLTPFAEKGSCTAQYAVGLSYMRSDDIKNDSLAIQWLLLAAEQKHAKAMGPLADCYFRNNKIHDYLVKAYLWGMLGAAYDPAQEINTITLLVKAYMKPEELERANKLIDGYEKRWHIKPNCQ
jgi:TPR repeat protein